MWNLLKKTEETDVEKAPEDLEVLINGVVFLIQRYKNRNSVICQRVEKTDKSIFSTFIEFQIFCKMNNIQYIRVEGNNRRYKRLLPAIERYLKSKDKDFAGHVVCDIDKSKKTNRNIFYVKLY